MTDALTQVTSYGYDEVGNRLSQTDANQHTTTYAYDQRGRRVQRTLPLGQTESYTYDANGNVLTGTDFNERTLRKIATRRAQEQTEIHVREKQA